MFYTEIDKIYFDTIREEKEKIIDMFQDILKDEWDRVKLGERK